MNCRIFAPFALTIALLVPFLQSGAATPSKYEAATTLEVEAGAWRTLPGPDIRVDSLQVAGTLYASNREGIRIQADVIHLYPGARILTASGPPGQAAVGAMARGGDGQSGGNLTLIAHDLILDGGSAIRPGSGGDGGYALSSLDAQGGSGGRGGSIHVTAARLRVQGALEVGTGGRGGDAVLLTSRLTSGMATGGNGGDSGELLVNGLPWAQVARAPALPAPTQSSAVACTDPATGISAAAGSGGNGGNACAEQITDDASPGGQPSCFLFFDENGGDGGNAAPATATATGGNGGSGNAGGGKGGDASASADAGDGGDGGDACDDGIGGNGGKGGTATATATAGSGGDGTGPNSSGGPGGEAAASATAGQGGDGGDTDAGTHGTGGDGGSAAATAHSGHGGHGVGCNSTGGAAGAAAASAAAGNAGSAGAGGTGGTAGIAGTAETHAGTGNAGNSNTEACESCTVVCPIPGTCDGSIPANTQCQVVAGPGSVHPKGLPRFGTHFCQQETTDLPLQCEGGAGDINGFGGANFGDSTWGGPKHLFLAIVNDQLSCTDATSSVCGFTVDICNDRDQDNDCTGIGDQDDELYTTGTGQGMVHGTCKDVGAACEDPNVAAWQGCMDESVFSDWSDDQISVFIGVEAGPTADADAQAAVSTGTYTIWLTNLGSCTPSFDVTPSTGCTWLRHADPFTPEVEGTEACEDEGGNPTDFQCSESAVLFVVLHVGPGFTSATNNSCAFQSTQSADDTNPLNVQAASGPGNFNCEFFWIVAGAGACLWI